MAARHAVAQRKGRQCTAQETKCMQHKAGRRYVTSHYVLGISKELPTLLTFNERVQDS